MTRQLLRCFFIFLLLLLPDKMLQSQIPNRTNAYWSPYFAGAVGPITEAVSASCIDASGNVYVAGNVETQGGRIIRVARWDGSRWHLLGDYLGTNSGFATNYVPAIAVDAVGNVYVGGDFNAAYNDDGSVVTTYFIAKWDAATAKWQAVGGGLSEQATNISCSPSGDVFVSGEFRSALQGDGSRASVNYIARWDGSDWHALGGGTNALITAMTVASDSSVYIGGEFTEVLDAGQSATATNHLARWNGTTWQPVGAGVTVGQQFGYLVAAIAPDRSGGVYVAGNIAEATNPDGSTVPGQVVHWNGSQFQSYGQGLFALSIADLSCDGQNVPYVLYYAGGGQTNADHWTGSAWETIGRSQGLGGPVTLAGDYLAGGQKLYMGGSFNDFENPLVPQTEIYARNALWNGAAWAPLVSNNDVGEVFAMAVDDPTFPGRMYVGGIFNSVNGQPAGNIASFDGNAWATLGGGVNGPVYAIRGTRIGGQPGVFVGGNFDTAENPDGSLVSASNIAFWDDAAASWFAIGDIDGPVYAIAPGTHSFNLYVGGAFTTAGGVQANNVVSYRLFNGSWEALGDGIDGTAVYALAAYGFGSFVWDTNLQFLFVGGDFQNAKDDPNSYRAARNLAAWNDKSKSWINVAGGTNAPVRAMALNHRSVSSPLWVGGEFTEVIDDNGNFSPAPYIAIWTRSQWLLPGQGVNAPVRTLAPEPFGRGCFVGGDFTEARDRDGTLHTVNHVAFFESVYANQGLQWDALGSGTDQPVHALQFLRSCPITRAGETVYAGGVFSRAGGYTVKGLAKWKFPHRRRRGVQQLLVRSSSSRSSQSNSRRSTRASVRFAYTSCAGQLAKTVDDVQVSSATALKFGESTVLDSLPHLVPFDLQVLDERGIAVFKMDSLIVDATVPNTLVMLGVDDTTAFAANPDGRSVGETAILARFDATVPAGADSVAAVFVQGITDLSAVALVANSGDTLARQLRYGELTGTLILPRADADLRIIRESDAAEVARLPLSLANVTSSENTIVLQGFVDPASNENGPGIAATVYEAPGGGTVSVAGTELIPDGFQLYPNYPNPFNPSTHIRFALPTAEAVEITILDITGKSVRRLFRGFRSAGLHSIKWDGRHDNALAAASGIYFVRLDIDGRVLQRKITLLK